MGERERCDPIGRSKADEPDSDRRALGDQGDRDVDLSQVGVDGVFCAWQDDQSRGVHAFTLGRRPKKEPGSEGLYTLKQCSTPHARIADPVADAGFGGDQALHRAGAVGRRELAAQA